MGKVLKFPEFRSAAIKDPRVVQFLKELETNKYKEDYTGLMDELKTMHVTREINRITALEVLQKQQEKLISAMLQNQANRSRSVTIKMECWRKCRALERKLGDLKKYLLYKYHDELKSDYGSINQQKGAIDNLFRKGIRITQELDSVIEIADLVIEDIDKAGWLSKNLLDTLTLSTRPERNI